MSCFICEKAGRAAGALVIADAYPVTPGHTLVAPLRHAESVDELTPGEWFDLWAVARTVAEESGGAVNIGMNLGEAAGQTVAHLHVHIIPRRSGDVDDPRGGIRGVIPSRRIYWEER